MNHHELFSYKELFILVYALKIVISVKVARLVTGHINTNTHFNYEQTGQLANEKQGSAINDSRYNDYKHYKGKQF